MRLYKLLPVFLLLLAGCAETADGTFVMNEETIENFFERDALKSWNPPADLNLDSVQPVAAAEIPPAPQGDIRLFGVLDSVGRYKTTAKSQEAFPGAAERGSTFHNSVYGMLGKAGEGGNAWYYADIDPINGQIINARAYLNGFMGGVCDLRQRPGQGWGKITEEGFSLHINGYCQFPDQNGVLNAFALVVQGKGDVLTRPAPVNMEVKYIMDNNGKFLAVPDNPASFWEIYDYGTGVGNVEQAGR